MTAQRAGRGEARRQHRALPHRERVSREQHVQCQCCASQSTRAQGRRRAECEEQGGRTAGGEADLVEGAVVPELL
eukprot:1277953-Rhodomonas_salina.1